MAVATLVHEQDEHWLTYWDYRLGGSQAVRISVDHFFAEDLNGLRNSMLLWNDLCGWVKLCEQYAPRREGFPSGERPSSEFRLSIRDRLLERAIRFIDG